MDIWNNNGTRNKYPDPERIFEKLVYIDTAGIRTRELRDGNTMKTGVEVVGVKDS